MINETVKRFFSETDETIVLAHGLKIEAEAIADYHITINHVDFKNGEWYITEKKVTTFSTDIYHVRVILTVFDAKGWTDTIFEYSTNRAENLNTIA